MKKKRTKKHVEWRENYHTKWKKDINEKRREQYHKDDNYRESILDRTRQSYREKNKLVNQKDALKNLPILKDMGVKRKCHFGDKVRWMVTFTCKELGEALGGYHVQSIYRLKSTGVLPEPVVAADVESNDFGRATVEQNFVYTYAEVKVMVKVVGEHQQKISRLSHVHTDTITKIFDGVEQERERLGYYD